MPSCWVPASERGLAADALLEVAVGGEHPDACGRTGSRPRGVGVEQAALAAGGHRHADGVADALAERPGGGLDAGGVVDLGVARGQRAPGAQRLQVVQLQAVAGEVELDVEGQARVAHREHEPVAADPVRVAGVVPQPLLEEQVGRRGHAHRRAGVAVADLLDGVHGQHADGVDRPAVEVAEARPGSVGCGWAGLPVGASVAASAGASDPVLCVMWCVLPRGSPGAVAPCACVCAVRSVAGPSSSTSRPTRCARSLNAINPSHPRSCRAVAATAAGYSGCGSRSRFERGPCCPGARRGDRTVRAASRHGDGFPVTAPPSARRRRTSGRSAARGRPTSRSPSRGSSSCCWSRRCRR